MMFRPLQVLGITLVVSTLIGVLVYWLGTHSQQGVIQLGMSEADVRRSVGTNFIYWPSLILIDTNDFDYDWDHEVLFWLLTTNPPRRLTFNLRSNLIGIESIKEQTNRVPFPWSQFDTNN